MEGKVGGMNEDSRIVIVGAGHGGGNMCAALRQVGHRGEIVLVGDEPRVPYHRPPLSKAYLKGSAAADSLRLRPESWYTGNNIVLRLGETVAAIDRRIQRVVLASGEAIPYDLLVLATGARARRLALPGSDLANIVTLRDLSDAETLRTVVQPGRTLAIVGGGYVGLEAAASVIGMGAHAVLLEREARILQRVACEPLARFFHNYHASKGVRILTAAQVCGFVGEDGRVSGVALANGETIGCDAVLLGVGAEVRDELARAAGLACEPGGVVVDDVGRTSDNRIYAVGDATWRPLPLYESRMARLESVPNATEQAKRAAHDIVGKPQPAHEVPWFWSDQYDVKLQIAGIPFDTRHLVVRGTIDSAKFAIFHLTAENRVQAVEAVNLPQAFMAGRTLIADDRAVDPGQLADPDVPLKELVRRGV